MSIPATLAENAPKLPRAAAAAAAAAAVSTFLLALLVELYATSQLHGWAEVQATIPDEALFIEVAKNGFLHFGAGYGPVFWLALTSILHLAPAGTEELLARILFVLSKYAAVALVGRLLWNEGQRLGAALFVIGVLASPGYMFLGKIISPEYLLLLFGALACCQLYKDEGRIGHRYFAALVLSILAVLCKLNALPLAGMIALHGALAGYRPGSVMAVAKRAARITAVFGGVLTLLVVATWPRNLIADIKPALALVPSLDLGYQALVTAWRLDDVTWDQIKLGGLGTDFLPVAALTIAATVLLPFAKKGPRTSASLTLYLAALAMTSIAVSHNMAHTWYVFLPCFLFAAAGASITASQPLRIQIPVLLLVAVAAAASAPRMRERVNFKLDRIRFVVAVKTEVDELLRYARAQLPCARTADFDILIPAPDQEGFRPVRLALQQTVGARWAAPDLLLVNRSDLLKNSPLLEWVVRGEFTQYALARRAGAVELYVRKDLPCYR